jgi:Histidine phosphatase superfamily (branch 1)
MSDALPVVYLARHGETAWTISRQHTGVTDLLLTPQGEAEAVRLGERLEGSTFAAVLTSPLQRAVRTCELAGFSEAAEVEPDLAEWDYGTYEGRTSAEIHAERPDWELFRDGCPGGESPDQVERGPTGWYAGCGLSRGMCCFFRADTFSECSPSAGSGSNRGRAGTSSWARPVSARWGTSITGPSR